jgi:hypothetical protein
MLLNSNSFQQWQTTGCTRNHYDINIDVNKIMFNWEETIMTEEVPLDDKWESPTTARHLEYSDVLKSWGIEPVTTKHYMSFCPTLPEETLLVLDNFKNNSFSYNFLKITAGHNVIWHSDGYATFIKRVNPPAEDYAKISRTAIMITDWTFGHVIQIGNDVLSHWSKGDSFTWTGDVWHGAGNFGSADMIIMQVTHL